MIINLDKNEFDKAPESSVSYTFKTENNFASINCDFLRTAHHRFPKESNFYHPCPPFSRFFLFNDGGAKVIAKDAGIYNLLPGRIYILPSGQAFEITYQPSDICAYHLHVHDFAGQSIFDNLKGVLELDNDILFNSIVSRVKNNNEKLAQILSFQAVLLFLEPVIEEIVSKANKASRYGNVMEIIKNGKTQDMNIDKLAEAMNISRAALSKGFKRAMGISLKDYITEIIVSRASRLLSYTDKTILEIADILGFEDPSYFHRVFKKNTGLTPKEYRKNSQEQPDYHELNKFK